MPCHSLCLYIYINLCFFVFASGCYRESFGTCSFFPLSRRAFCPLILFACWSAPVSHWDFIYLDTKLFFSFSFCRPLFFPPLHFLLLSIPRGTYIFFPLSSSFKHPNSPCIVFFFFFFLLLFFEIYFLVCTKYNSYAGRRRSWLASCRFVLAGYLGSFETRGMIWMKFDGVHSLLRHTDKLY